MAANAAFLTRRARCWGDLASWTRAATAADTERVALQELFNMIRHFSSAYKVEMAKRTVECGLLSLIGPQADAVAQAAFDAAPGAAEHDHVVSGRGAVIPHLAGDRPAVRHGRRLSGCGLAAIQAGADRSTETAAEILRIEHGARGMESIWTTASFPRRPA